LLYHAPSVVVLDVVTELTSIVGNVGQNVS
jgi:hypothetical protein